MYPEQDYAPYPANQGNGNNAGRLKKRLIIGIPVLLLVIVLLTVFRPKSVDSFQPYVVSNTNLTAAQHFGHLEGSDLYSYNGVAFYKTSLVSDGQPGKTTVLNTGLKLPAPGKIYWADSRGAMLSFKQSFTLTKVEEVLAARQLPLNDITRSYTWYLDFATGSLKLVDQQPVVPDLVHYSKADKGFYYVTGYSDTEGSATPMNFYNIATGQSTVIVQNLAVTDMGDIRKCPAAPIICFTARDIKDPVSKKLYGIDRNKQKRVILDSKGRLFPSNDPSLYVAVGRGEDSKAVSGNNNVEQADYPAQPAVLFNIQNSTAIPLGFTVEMSEPAVHFSDAQQFYIIDNTVSQVAETDEDKQTPSYRTGRIVGTSAKSELQPFAYSDNKPFDDVISSITSHGDGSLSLLTAIDGSQVIFSDARNTAELAATDPEAAKNTVKACISSGTVGSQYFEETREFRVLFTADDKFAQNIAAFSTCMTRPDKIALTGYSFHFAGRDPFNGRLSTD